MTKDYKEITGRISKNMGTLRKLAPEAMGGFSKLAAEAGKDGALDEKTKEYIALAIGVSQRCDGCIGFHVKKLLALGASKEEIAEVLAMCVYMGGGPALMYAAEAIEALEQFSG